MVTKPCFCLSEPQQWCEISVKKKEHQLLIHRFGEPEFRRLGVTQEKMRMGQ